MRGTWIHEALAARQTPGQTATCRGFGIKSQHILGPRNTPHDESVFQLEPQSITSINSLDTHPIES